MLIPIREVELIDHEDDNTNRRLHMRTERCGTSIERSKKVENNQNNLIIQKLVKRVSTTGLSKLKIGQRDFLTR